VSAVDFIQHILMLGMELLNQINSRHPKARFQAGVPVRACDGHPRHNQACHIPLGGGD